MHVLKHVVTDLILVVGLFFSLGEAPAQDKFAAINKAKPLTAVQVDAGRGGGVGTRSSWDALPKS